MKIFMERVTTEGRGWNEKTDGKESTHSGWHAQRRDARVIWQADTSFRRRLSPDSRRAPPQGVHTVQTTYTERNIHSTSTLKYHIRTLTPATLSR